MWITGGQVDNIKPIPSDYLDGCTYFPDRFGKISHRHVCIEHDKRYWYYRTVPDKFVADFIWFRDINKAHKNNTLFWKIAAIISSVLGYVALSTFGWYFWRRRAKYDKNK